jgi:hypothetical protein
VLVRGIVRRDTVGVPTVCTVGRSTGLLQRQPANSSSTDGIGHSSDASSNGWLSRIRALLEDAADRIADKLSDTPEDGVILPSTND